MSAFSQAEIDRWLPRWRALIDLALAAANDAADEPRKLKEMADEAGGIYGHRNSGWVIILEAKGDAWTARALIAVAQAFCRQNSGVMRHTLADALKEITLAFAARLARQTAPPGETPQLVPIIPLRRRVDIHGAED